VARLACAASRGDRLVGAVCAATSHRLRQALSPSCRPKTSTPPTNSTFISGLSFCAWYTGNSAPRILCTENGRILLANLLQSSRSTFSRGSLLSFLAFKEGMLGTPISVLGGWPTVSAR